MYRSTRVGACSRVWLLRGTTAAVLPRASFTQTLPPCTHPPHPCSECARLIAKEGHSVEWHTPLGLPVVQPYRRKERQHVRTLLQVR